MTQTQNFTINNAQLIVTATVRVDSIKLSMTIDFAELDKNEPDHSDHGIINYIKMPLWKTGQSYWWCRLHRQLTVKTGSQARRVINSLIPKLDDIISSAILDRERRKSEMKVIFN